MRTLPRVVLGAVVATGFMLPGLAVSAAHGPGTGTNGAQCLALPNDNGTYTVEIITPSGHIQQRFNAKRPPAGCEVVL